MCNSTVCSTVQQEYSRTAVLVSTHQQPIHYPPRAYIIVQQYRSTAGNKTMKKEAVYDII